MALHGFELIAKLILMIEVACNFKGNFILNRVQVYCIIVLMICVRHHADYREFLLFCIDYDIEAV